MAEGEAVELIVEFVRGVSEDEARAVVKKSGANIRRRMLTDHQDQVMLLIRLDSARVDAVKAELTSDEAVKRVENNNKDYRLL